ncbi:autotransporter outer membrane beta-barrel domain-containing protein [Neisseria sp. Marseille-Q1983]|uniref:autotransporter outer membrane beta-barrel domain-containing protein n=1 Tax=Neisseria sp. Marseille-Q1983 TaxID=2830768 RepID=UPI001BA7FE78|nr:autotransporter outer membrane beta-barrel domain-containing protein [Neisseria sp. Marseille-Q1983]
MKDETIARCLLSGCLLALGMEKSIAASGTILEKNNYTAAIAGKNQTNEHTFDYSGETAVKPINSLVIAAYGKGAVNTITVKGNPSVGEKDLKDASGEASLKDARGEVLKEPAHWTIQKEKPVGYVSSGRYKLQSSVANAGILLADLSYEGKNNITLENVSVKNTSSQNAIFANDTLDPRGMSDTTLTFKGNNYLYTDGTKTSYKTEMNGIQLLKNNKNLQPKETKNHTKIESEAGSNLNIYVQSGTSKGRGIGVTQYRGVIINTSGPRKTVINQTEMDFRGAVSIKVDRGDKENAENYGVYVGNLPEKNRNSEDVPDDSYDRVTFHSDVKIDVQPVLEESGKQKSIGDALNVDGKNSRVDIKGDGTVQIDGDIHVLNGGVIDLNLKNKNSYLNGEAHIGKQRYTGDPDDPDNPPDGQNLFDEDRKNSASSINMTMKDGARWNVQNTSKINGLDISNGAEVSFSDGGRNVNVSVSRLKGDGGVFKMQGDIVSGKTDKLITREGSEGTHIIEYTDNAKAKTTGREYLKLVENQAGGGASYKLHVRCTEHGGYCYSLGESENSKYVKIDPDGKGDRYLFASTLSTGASSSVLFGEALYQLNAVSDETLVQRMGEIHADGTPQEDNNVWLKRVGGKFVGSRSDYRVGGYSNRYWGFAGGFNRTGFGDKWIHYKGLMLRHLQSSYASENYAGSGKIYGRAAGVYSTWLNRESRAYYDLVANVARYKGSYGLTNYSGVRVESDEARLNAYMLSAETGRRMEKQDGGKTYWWQPEAQLSYWFTRGYGFSLSNGLDAETDNFRSLMGRFGFRAGVDGLDGGRLNIYGKLMYKREFIGTIRHRFNGSAVEEFKHRGGWLEYGLGVVRRNAENGRQLYFEAQRSSMHTMRQNWQVNMGVRSMF